MSFLRAVTTGVAATAIVFAILIACFNPWSPSFCADGQPGQNAQCLWSTEKPGGLDNEPDFSAEAQMCNGVSGQFGGSIYIGTFGGSGWLYTCCFIPSGGPGGGGEGCEPPPGGCSENCYWDEEECICKENGT